MARRYFNHQGGTITDDPLSSGATTFNSAGLAQLPAVTAPDTVAVVLDPAASVGDPEIVIITAHTASATSATITRGAEGTTARAHDVDEPWATAFTAADADELPFRKATTKGDILAATAANTVTRLGVGTNSLVLQGDSSTATGLKYGQVVAAGIASDAVTTAKIADSQVTSAKIADGTIVLADLAAALIETLCPAGTIRTTINTSADTGWLLFGQTVSGAESLYPTLWGKAPSSWKSGSDLILPTDDEMVLRGNTAGVGSTSGANTKTIATANLPSHSHTINHNHTAGTTGAASANHTHTYSGTTSSGGAHNHTPASLFSFWQGGFDVTLDVTDGEHGASLVSHTSTDGAHAHTFSGSTSGQSTTHSHSFDVATYSGSSGSTGSGTALNVQEAGINVRFQIKAH